MTSKSIGKSILGMKNDLKSARIVCEASLLFFSVFKLDLYSRSAIGGRSTSILEAVTQLWSIATIMQW